MSRHILLMSRHTSQIDSYSYIRVKTIKEGEGNKAECLVWPLQAKSPVSVSSPSSGSLEQFDALSQRPMPSAANNNLEPDPFDLSALGKSRRRLLSALYPNLARDARTHAINTKQISFQAVCLKKLRQRCTNIVHLCHERAEFYSAGNARSPAAFLGQNSGLVNLERLLAAPPHNPFQPPPRHVFQPPPPVSTPTPLTHSPTHGPKLSINELKQQQLGLAGAPFPSASPPPPPADPWAPAPPPASAAPPAGGSPWSPPATRHTPNPFLS
ncbi:hypothetical protein ACJJTC_012346 [Scirpophaga incertulas]